MKVERLIAVTLCGACLLLTGCGSKDTKAVATADQAKKQVGDMLVQLKSMPPAMRQNYINSRPDMAKMVDDTHDPALKSAYESIVHEK
jgi:hypothetical protein